jgi:hypothetical protein
MNQHPVLKTILALTIGAAVLAGSATSPANAQSGAAIPPALVTPDKVQTSIGTLEFKDGAPTVGTTEKVRDTLDFVNAVNVFNNSFRGASAFAIRKGFHSIGAQDNTVIVFPELMDAKSLFLTANADTVYYMAVVDLTKGPMVVEQPPMGLGTINDMWFSWIVDIGFPGPDRGEGASTWWCRRATPARCPRAASSSPSRRPIGCFTRRVRSS